MKSLSKTMQKILSVLLACLFVMEMAPLQTLAVSSTATNSEGSTEIPVETEQKSDLEETEEEAYILSEDIQKREENIKHFRMSDGTMQAVQYTTPVHYEKDGVWSEYDNTLTEVDADEEENTTTFFRSTPVKSKDFINKSSDFTVRLSKKTNKHKFVRIEKDGYKISWCYENAKTSKGKYTEAVKDDDPKTLENLTSTVLYKNVFLATNLEYILQSEGVKENIILKSKKAPTSFTVQYKANGLTPVVVDDQTIELRANDGKVIYTLSAPYMEDAKGETSTAISFSLQNVKKNSFKVLITLDETWLHASEREFPVLVDPLLETSQKWDDATNCHSAYVASATPKACYGRGGANYEGSLYVGKTNGRGVTRTFIKTPNLPKLSIADKVVQAEMDVFVTACYPELRMDLYSVSTPWEQNTICWNNQAKFDPTIVDYQIVQTMDRSDDGKDRWQQFEITDLVRSWYSGERPNYGVCLCSDAERSSSQARAWLLSSGYTSASGVRPVLAITYRNMAGYEDYWSYTNLGAGRGGMVSVNNYNGNLVYSQPVTQNDGGNLMPVQLSVILNANKAEPQHSRLGDHMQTNYHIYVRYDKEMEKKGYKYFMNDADGTVHWFRKTDKTGEFKDEDGLGLTLTEIKKGSIPNVPQAVYQITDKDENKMYFHPNGNLLQLANAAGIATNITYEQVNGVVRMRQITDGAGRAYTFKYLSGYPTVIERIIDPAGRATSFTYNRGTVTKITFADGKQVQLVHNYDNYTLTEIKSFDGTRVKIGYDNSKQRRVTFVNWGVNDNKLLEKYSFVYQQNTTHIRDIHNRSYTYQFNDLGQTTGVVSDTDGSAQFFKLHAGNAQDNLANKLFHESRVIKPVTNYVVNPGFARDLSAGYSTYIQNTANQSVSIDTTKKNMTSNALKIQKNASNGARVNVVQRVNGLPAGTYTFSSYVNTAGAKLTGYAWIGVEVWSADGKVVGSYWGEGINSTKDWERQSVTFSTPSNCEVRLLLGFWQNGSGTVWYDDLQLEKGEGVSHYNLVENSAFLNGSTKWSSQDGTPAICVGAGLADLKTCGKLPKTVNDEWNNMVQYIPVGGKKGDALTYGMWVDATSAPINNGMKEKDRYKPLCEINLNYYDMNGKWAGQARVDCNADLKGTWQFVSDEFIVPIDYSKLSISFRYAHNVNAAYVTGACCFKEQYGQSYTYDKKGNVVSAVDLAKTNSAFTYSGNQMSKMLNPSGSEYIYAHNLKKQLTYALSSDGQGYGFTYDNKGNVTKSEIEKMQFTDHLESGKEYIVINSFSGFAMDSSEKQQNGTPVFTNDYRKDRRNQHWKFTAVAGEPDVYTLQVMAFSDRYLDVYQGDGKHNNKICTYPHNSSVAQKFKFVKQADGSYGIFTKASNYTRCIDAQLDFGKEIINCADIKQANCNRNDLALSQKWYIYEVPSATAQKIETDATYTPSGNFVSTQSDQRGNTTSYTYNEQKGALTSTTDAKGNKTDYTYDANNNSLLSVTSGGMTNRYAYENDRLKTINVNGALQYQFNYDEFGRTTSTRVGNGTNWRTLSSLAYNNRGLMQKQTYGNGDYITFAYDNLDRTTQKQYNGLANQRVTYAYNSNGDLAQTYDFLSGTRTQFIYDLVGRVVEQKEYNSTAVSGGTLLNSTKFTYADKTNYLTGVEHKSPLGTQQIGYRYGKLNIREMPDQIYDVTWNGAKKVSYVYDDLGRLKNKQIGGKLNNSFTYEDVGGNRTTTLVKSVETAAGTFTYTYDTLGNIVSISDGKNTTSYVYDSLNQLVRSNNQKAGKTYTYAYKNGNITEKKEYAYTEGALGEVLHTTTWGYGDSTWSDLLTKFNGEAITYDAIGNPLTIGNKTLTWQGRQLQSITDGANTYSYKYNMDGQRLSKTVNGVTTEYFYNGDILAGQKTGDNTLVFMYDNNGDVFGFTYNGTEYFYVKNAQNDVVAITDTNGTIIARYAYDDWGKVTSVTDANGVEIPDETHIANINPLRYRSYYWDAETDFYHLKTRYYAPQMCRFLNADIFMQTGQGMLDKNVFSYCINNPINRIDLEGTVSLTLLHTFFYACCAVIGVAVIGTIGILWAQPQTQQAIAQTAQNVKDTVEEIGDNISAKDQSVYIMRDEETNAVQYVGRTNDPHRRQNEHKRNPRKAHLKPLEIKFTGLSIVEARIVEQTLISAYTLDNLMNARREISKRKLSNCANNIENIIYLFGGIVEDEILNLMGR